MKLEIIWKQILDLVFPPHCLVCGKAEDFLCPSCIIKLPKLERQKCIVCSMPSPFGKTHSGCKSRKKIDGIISALPYKDLNVKKLIETFKYKYISDLSPALSKIIGESFQNYELQNFFKDFSLIPVPLHKKRLVWRGFNQSMLLAQELSRNLNIKIDNSLIERVKYTKPQVELGLKQRKQNIKNAFKVQNRLTHLKFLLVDDVVTTGSTLNEMAKTLKRSGATEVWAITLAAD
ncbi:MAG TPA: ComF family protein [Verrucomicrobiae bacterium]|nr:ComF family protein [Verrucomicrobiae bacterium]